MDLLGCTVVHKQNELCEICVISQPGTPFFRLKPPRPKIRSNGIKMLQFGARQDGCGLFLDWNYQKKLK